MDHLIEVSTKVTWPGALVLTVLIIAIAAVVISLFGDQEVHKDVSEKDDDSLGGDEPFCEHGKVVVV